jgi:hypothetical protein
MKKKDPCKDPSPCLTGLQTELLQVMAPRRKDGYIGSEHVFPCRKGDGFISMGADVFWTDNFCKQKKLLFRRFFKICA